MWPRISILLGLVLGVTAGALILGALLFLTPITEPRPRAVPTASPSPSPSAAPSPSPSPSAAPSPSPSPSAAPSPTVAPSASASSLPSPSSSASPSAAAGLFHFGEPVPALVLPKVGGGTP